MDKVSGMDFEQWLSEVCDSTLREKVAHSVEFNLIEEAAIDEEAARAYRLKRVNSILKRHGIRMAVWGCGCCGSPCVSFEYNGELIVDSEDGFIIEMADNKKEG